MSIGPMHRKQGEALSESVSGRTAADALRQAQPAVRKAAGMLAPFPVVVGVTYDPKHSRAVIVIREIGTGIIIRKIPADSQLNEAELVNAVATRLHGHQASGSGRAKSAGTTEKGGGLHVGFID